MKKSYDFGYEDGYRDCKEYYEKILTSLTKEINDYKNTIEILDLKLRLAYDKNSEEKDLIAIGRAVKALVKEIEMIVSAAVKIFDYRQNKEWCIPCHRHSDAFFILKEFGYKKFIDYKEISQGFLDEHGQFYNRIDAYKEAARCNQLLVVSQEPCALYSEDLW